MNPIVLYIIGIVMLVLLGLVGLFALALWIATSPSFTKSCDRIVRIRNNSNEEGTERWKC